MFDTIRVKAPLTCPNCGAEIFEVQTHELGDIMATYVIGSVLNTTPVHTGIVKESLWCTACHNAGREGSSPVFLVIWHSVLAGVEQNLANAEALMGAVDRLDLIGWLDEAQGEALRWKRRYHSLFSDVEKWVQHQAEPPEAEPGGSEAEAASVGRVLQRLWRLPEEILAAPNPLAAILEKARSCSLGDRRASIGKEQEQD
jgi:hypothetical protein